MGFSAAYKFAAALAACVALFPVPHAAAQSISDKLNNWLFGTYAAPSADPANPNTPAEIDCPGVDIRQGASTLAVTAPGSESGPMTTRYQVSIAQTARECAALGGVMTMKVGVQGRILLGPAGGPGQVDIPLRMAVVQEGPAPKTVVSKFHKMVVAVPPGQTSVPFAHVEQDLTFPMPRPKDFDAYVVYVGFDPASLNSKPERPAKKQKPKRQ